MCGAVITAGSLIGLGLLSIGIGTRYNFFSRAEPSGALEYIRLRDMDSVLLLCLVFLIICALIGLGVSFLGLAYHHNRRYHEHQRAFAHDGTGSPRATL
jgi:hypothetical protein